MARSKREKRGKKRYRVSDLNLEYSEGNLFSFFRRKPSGENRPLVDFSADGLQFLAREELTPGTQLKLTVALPNTEKPVKVDGEVRWTQKISGRQLYRTGVQFVKPGETGRDVLEQYEQALGEHRIRVLCNSCGAAFATRKKLEGRKAKCPKCGTVIEIVAADPESRDAESGAHITAPRPPVEPSKQLSDALRQFLKRNATSRLHLEVIQHAGRSNVFAVKDLARALRQKEKTILDICRELQNKGVLREVGVRNFNLAAGTAMRKIILDLQRSSKAPKQRAAILALVIDNEMKK